MDELISSYKQMPDIMNKVNDFYEKYHTCRDCPYITQEESDRLEQLLLNGKAKPYDREDKFYVRMVNEKNREQKLTSRLGSWVFKKGLIAPYFPSGSLDVWFLQPPSANEIQTLKEAGFHGYYNRHYWSVDLDEHTLSKTAQIDFLTPVYDTPVSILLGSKQKQRKERVR